MLRITMLTIFFVNVMFTDYLYLRNAADIYFVMDQFLSPE